MKEKIKISEQELRAMVREVVKNKFINEAQDFSARREVVLAAQQASMNFEKIIIKTLKMKDPDELETSLQKQYYSVVEGMKDDIVKSVMNAAKKLVAFPKRENPSKVK